MNDYELSPVQDEDIGMMSRIHLLSFDDAWTGAMIRRILTMPGTFGIVARDRRHWTVSGFALLRLAADECEVLSLAVAPERRGAGVGGLLFGHDVVQSRIVGNSYIRLIRYRPSRNYFAVFSVFSTIILNTLFSPDAG